MSDKQNVAAGKIRDGEWAVRNGVVVEDADACPTCGGSGRLPEGPENKYNCGNCGLWWRDSLLERADWRCRCGWHLSPGRESVILNIAWELAWRAQDSGELPPKYDENGDETEDYDAADALFDVYVNEAKLRLDAQSDDVIEEIARTFHIKRSGEDWWFRSSDDWRGEFSL